MRFLPALSRRTRCNATPFLLLLKLSRAPLSYRSLAVSPLSSSSSGGASCFVCRFFAARHFFLCFFHAFFKHFCEQNRAAWHSGHALVVGRSTPRSDPHRAHGAGSTAGGFGAALPNPSRPTNGSTSSQYDSGGAFRAPSCPSSR